MPDDTRPDPFSPEQRAWNRENHGRKVKFRVPIAELDADGDAVAIGYHEYTTTLITDPDRLGEGFDLAPEWTPDNEETL